MNSHMYTRPTRRSGVTWALLVAMLAALLTFSNTPTYAVSGTLTFDDATDFNSLCATGSFLASPAFSNVTLTDDASYELRLTPTITDNFAGSSLSSQWQSGVYSGSGTPTVAVASGSVTLVSNQNTGNYVETTSNVTTRTGVFEAQAQFGNGRNQFVGLSVGGNNPGFYIGFSTANTPGTLSIVREGSDGGYIVTPLPGVDPSQSLRLRIERYFVDNPGDPFDQFIFYVNGSQVQSIAMGSGAADQIRRIRFSNATSPSDAASTSLSVAWVRFIASPDSPVSANGTYTSCPIQTSTGQRSSWREVSWTTQTVGPNQSNLNTPTPTTNFGVEIRAADSLSALNSASWVSIPGNGSLPSSTVIGTFAQYRLTFQSSDSDTSPAIDAVSIAFTDPPAPSSPYATITPGLARYDSLFLFQGDGFAASTALTVTVNGQSITTTGLSSDASGAAAFYLDSRLAETNTGAGQIHNLVVSDGASRTVTLDFTVTGTGSASATPPAAGTPPTYTIPAPSCAAGTLTPRYAAGSTSRTVTGCGFARNATLSATIGGNSVAFAPTTDINGIITAANSFVPTSLGIAPGSYTLVVSGNQLGGGGTRTQNYALRVQQPDDLSPTTARDGTFFRARGSGFTANTTLTITVDGSNLGTTTADADGEFDLYLDSTSTAVGSHTVVVSGAGRSNFSQNLTVDANGTLGATSGSPNFVMPAVTCSGPTPTTETYLAAGTNLNVTGCGYARGETITFTIGATTVGTTTADGNGAFSYAFDTTGRAPGSYTLVANGTTFPRSSTARTNNYTFRIQQPDVISPSSARDGTFFRVAGSGFTANTTLTITVDGSNLGTTTADADGEFDLYLDSTSTAVGSHTVVVSGAGRSNFSQNLTVDANGTLGATSGSPNFMMPAVTCSGPSQSAAYLSAGVQLTVTGCGYARGETITFTIGATTVGTTTADGNGAFSYAFDTTGRTPGSYTLVANGTTFPRSSAARSDSYTFTIAQPLAMSPASARYDTRFLAEGSGFSPNITLTLTLDGVALGTVQSDVNGEFRFFVDSQRGETGAHAVVVTGQSSGGTRSEQLNFTVTATGSVSRPDPGSVTVFNMPDPLCNPATITPNAGEPDDTFTMQGCGFGRNSTITITIGGVTVGSATADVNGRFSATIDASALDDGSYTVSANGTAFVTGAAQSVTATLTINVTEFIIALPLVVAP